MTTGCKDIAYCLVGYFILRHPVQRGPKRRTLRWTVYIFKTSEPICMIFGTLQHCFVLNTYVNSILNRFIKPGAPTSDKVNNSVFHLQNQARSLHSNVHVFKNPHQLHNSWHNWTSWY